MRILNASLSIAHAKRMLAHYATSNIALSFRSNHITCSGINIIIINCKCQSVIKICLKPKVTLHTVFSTEYFDVRFDFTQIKCFDKFPSFQH